MKNDISFWKNNKSMRGLSLSTMLMNLFFQTVIFLYLCDNDTSYMVLGTNGIGVLIEYWKISKVVTLDRFRDHVANGNISGVGTAWVGQNCVRFHWNNHVDRANGAVTEVEFASKENRCML